MTTSDDNPFRAPQSSFQPVERKSHPKLRLLRIFVGLQCTTIALGVAFALYDIESIVVTGPILSVTGVGAALFSRRHQQAGGIIFGLSGPVITLFCFVLIDQLNWSPRNAQYPVSLIAMVYATCTLPLGLHVWTRTDSDSVAAVLEEQVNDSLITDDDRHQPTNMG